MIYVTILKTNQSNPLKIDQIQTKHLSLSFVLGRNEPLIQSFNEATNYKGILINGMEGSGEEVLAKALLPKHAQVIDALNLLEHSPIDYSTIPLFIRNIDALAETEQTHVLQTIEAFSEPVVIHSKLLLTTDDQLYPIQLPSLIEREKEWDQFVRKLIGEANQLYGKQVIGYRGELPEIALKRYEWLIEYVFSLVKSSIQPHITLSETSNHFISLHKSLEEIEKDIIKHVLAEEDFNQSKAAERLQINRTTLWRKLK